MNKYKMISIVSFVLSCILVLSLLIPVKTIANDKESLEMSMHYEDSKVTVDISVNSEIYTGVICKYIIVDDVLKSDDLLAQTKNSGTTINLDKNENDKYTTVIPNVNKRYVVIYVSIGNCSLCDYLDCQPNKAQNDDKKNQDEEKKDNDEHKQTVEGESVDGQQIEKDSNENKEENKQENKDENKEENKQENKEENKEENKQENKEENKEENKQENKEENKEENKQENKEENKEENKQENKNENKEEQKPQVNKEPEQKNENKQPVQNQSQNNTSNSGNNAQKSSGNTAKNSSDKIVDLKNYDKDKINTGDKDSIDMSGFQEIEKTSTTTTADENMPKTGEDDFVKILGIIVFSTISMISFYKYKITK